MNCSLNFIPDKRGSGKWLMASAMSDYVPTDGPNFYLRELHAFFSCWSLSSTWIGTFHLPYCHRHPLYSPSLDSNQRVSRHHTVARQKTPVTCIYVRCSSLFCRRFLLIRQDYLGGCSNSMTPPLSCFNSQ